MSDQPALRVSGLGKRYPVYARNRDRLLEALTGRPRHRDFWALRDVSFDLPCGEVLGIVGRNGAGKSTLLRLLAGTLTKTTGVVEVHGRVSAILELGTGFHPDQTGRDNIVVAGMCLGMSKAEVLRKSDSIIEFAELREFIDRPLRTYSSGMQARLAFSTAISIQPDVLIIDEVLAVGDVLFNEKSFTRIREIAAGGATIVFVTHSLQTLYRLCTTGMLLHRGELIFRGTPREAGYAYEELLARQRPDQEAIQAPPATTAPTLGGSAASIEDVYVVGSDGGRCTTLGYGDRYRLIVRVRFHEDVDRTNVAFRFEQAGGTIVTGDNTLFRELYVGGARGQVKEVSFHWMCRLCNGTYFVTSSVTRPRSMEQPALDYSVLAMRWGAASFDVVDNPFNVGVTSLESEISVDAAPVVSS